MSCVHSSAPTFADTDWVEIVALYDVLMRLTPSAAVRVNRAIAVAECRGPEAGLALLDDLSDTEERVRRWHHFHVARASMLEGVNSTTMPLGHGGRR